MGYKKVKLKEGFTVSTEGEIWATRSFKDWILRRPAKERVTFGASEDYPTATLGAEGVPAEVHIITWLAFNGEIPLDMIVDHKNLRALADPRLEGLELVTKQQYVDKRLDVMKHFSKAHLFMTPDNFSDFYENIVDASLSFQLRTLREQIEVHVYDTDHTDIIEYIQKRAEAAANKTPVEDPMIYLEKEKAAAEEEEEPLQVVNGKGETLH